MELITCNFKENMKIQTANTHKNVDVIFECEIPYTSIIEGNKDLLANVSPVFKAMFYGPLSNATSNPTMIKIIDLSSYTMKSLINFIKNKLIPSYNDPGSCFENKHQFLIELLYASKKYMLKELEIKISNMINNDINIENVCYYMQYSHLFGNIDTHLCWKILSINVEFAIDSPTFLDMPRETVLAFFLRDDLMCNELVVLKGILRWIQQDLDHINLPFKCGVIKERYGSILHAIRFPLLSLEDLNEYVIRQGILEASDLVEIMFYHTHMWSLSKSTFSCRLRSQAYTVYPLLDKVSIKNNYNPLPLTIADDSVRLTFLGRFILTGLLLPNFKTNLISKLSVTITQLGNILYRFDLKNRSEDYKNFAKYLFERPAFLYTTDQGTTIDISLYVEPRVQLDKWQKRFDAITLKYGKHTEITVNSTGQYALILGLLM